MATPEENQIDSSSYAYENGMSNVRLLKGYSGGYSSGDELQNKT